MCIGWTFISDEPSYIPLQIYSLFFRNLHLLHIKKYLLCQRPYWLLSEKASVYKVSVYIKFYSISEKRKTALKRSLNSFICNKHQGGATKSMIAFLGKFLETSQMSCGNIWNEIGEIQNLKNLFQLPRRSLAMLSYHKLIAI